jgi:hypothetical protein
MEEPQSPAPAPAPRVKTLAVPPVPLQYIVLNVFFATLLLIVVFVTGSAWTNGASSFVAGQRASGSRMLVFAAAMTVVTLGASVGIAAWSQSNPNIRVNVQGLLNS